MWPGPRPTPIPSGILIHAAICHNTSVKIWWGCSAPLFGGGGRERDPHLTQCHLGEIYLCTKWHLNRSSRLATTDMGQKFGAVSLLGRGAGSPFNVMWPWPRPTSVPSFILIHPTIWPQCTSVTDRTDRQTMV